MDITTSISLPSVIITSVLLSACCPQQIHHPKPHRAAPSGNCHTHNNGAHGTIRHCHPYTDIRHRHNYGNARRPVVRPRPQPQPQYRAKPSYDYPSYYDTKKKGYYRGEVDSVLDPYAKNVMRDYREY